ncbi:MAG: polar amino acid transport system substrate-binding protein [Oceanicoccus sp.]
MHRSFFRHLCARTRVSCFTGVHEYDGEIGAEILKVAYSRIDIQLSTVEYPGKRSLNEANLGNLDGETQRVIGLEKQYPDLIMVPPPVGYLEPYFFLMNKNITIESCRALENYPVGIVRGILYSKRCAESVRDLIVVDDFSVLMKLVGTGRIDVAMATKVNGLSELSRQNMKAVHLLAPPPLEPIKLYHYIHEKNSRPVPKNQSGFERKGTI